MDLFLIRHTKAAEQDSHGEDSERPLTADGRRAAREVGAALARHGVTLDAIVTSPLVRAVETAELVAVEVGYPGGLGVSGALEPGGPPGRILSEVLEPVRAERVALVGHEPSMGQLLSTLLGKGGLSLSKGAAVRLAWDGRRARLVWIVKPKRLEPVTTLDGL